MMPTIMTAAKEGVIIPGTTSVVLMETSVVLMETPELLSVVVTTTAWMLIGVMSSD